MDQSQEILLGHAIFASSEYRMTQLPSYCTFDYQYNEFYARYLIKGYALSEADGRLGQSKEFLNMNAHTCRSSSGIDDNLRAS